MAARTFVIVHGAWGGSSSWTPLAEALRGQGHRAFTPSLTGLGERRHLLSGRVNLSTHIQDVIGTVESEELCDFVLVGHSYGGMVITGVADRLADRISHIAYLDAFLPTDGQCAFDFIGTDGMIANLKGASEHDGVAVPPVSRNPGNIPEALRFYVKKRGLHPLATLVENLHLTGAGAGIAHKLYVLCTAEQPTIFTKAYERVKADDAWTTETMPCGHMLQLEMLERLTEVLTGFAAA
jgi:pimeloyl-ACP methyl ester carboxylesterase